MTASATTYRRFLYTHAYLLVLAAWLFTLSFVVDNYWSVNASLKGVKNAISKDLHEGQKQVQKWWRDTALIRSVASGKYTEKQLIQLQEEKAFLFMYAPDSKAGDRLVFWNTQQVLPYPSLLYDTREQGFMRGGNGYYVWMKKNIGTYRAIALIPVKWSYAIQNDYLHNSFRSKQIISANFEVSADTGRGLPVLSVDGKRLFHVFAKDKISFYKSNPLAVAMKALALILALVFVQLFSVFIKDKKGIAIASLFLGAVLLIIRLSLIYFPGFLNLQQFALFDPAWYAANAWAASLGDLLLHALFITWFILFLHRYLQPPALQDRPGFGKSAFMLLGLGSVLLVAVSFLAANSVRSLVSDPRISFDVMNFFTLNGFSVIGFFILACICIGYFFFCQMLVEWVRAMYKGPTWVLLLALCITGLLALSFRIGNIRGGFDLFVLGWLILFVGLLVSRWLTLISTRIISSRMVIWLFFFSVSVTGILMAENNRKELDNRKRYAEILLQKSDPSKETMVNSLLTAFDSSFLAARFERFYKIGDNLFLKDSLINSNPSGFTNRYDTRVYVFDAKEQPLFNADSVSFAQVNIILNTQSKPTATPGLFYFDEAYDAYSYICKRSLYAPDSSLLGYVFILASPKKFKKDALYPELFSRGNQSDIEQSGLYAFAQYSNWKLIRTYNDYPFPSTLSKRDFRGEAYYEKQKGTYNELWFHAGGGRVVGIVKESRWFIEAITLFSYLFCSFLLVTAIFWLISAIVRSKFNAAKFLGYWQMTIRTQIHGTIIFISVLSFIIIGVATILFFVNRYESNNREKLSRTIRIMEKEVRNAMGKGWLMNDSLQTVERAFGPYIEQTVNKISEIHGVDVNLYDLDGNLRISSLPMLYTRGLLSTKMQPNAYYHLATMKEVQFQQEEYVGRLSFASNYVPVKDQQGNDYAYLHIPYFTSQSNLRQEISNFLVTIINLNAFIFLIAGIIALFITNRITRSFSIIGEKMKKINIGAHNEAIEWKRKDELGILVEEYNKMVSQLEDSVQAMAKAEREGAWREMARQVAHEIKNPLTPMKLSLQYLQKAIEQNAPNVPELSRQVSHTLIEQINHLNKIAGDFSQFAHIGESARERVDLNAVLNSVLSLYQSDQRVSLHYQLSETPAWIIADKTHLNRLFNNLILNAIQSVPDDRLGQIELREDIREGRVRISISDNGQGIDESLRANIFTPNFTTKTSGTGLGLAMCKRIVEQADGEIWFDTVPGEGTTFFVQFPLAAG